MWENRSENGISGKAPNYELSKQNVANVEIQTISCGPYILYADQAKEDRSECTQGSPHLAGTITIFWYYFMFIYICIYHAKLC